MNRDLALKISAKLAEKLDGSKQDVEIWAYGLEIILNSVIKFLIIAVLSVFLGIFQYTMFCIIAFAFFRHFGGGVHFSTYLRCLSFGVMTFLISGKIASLDKLSIIQEMFFYMTLVLGVLTIVKWVPADTKKKPIKEKEKIKEQKMKTTVVLVFWLILTIFLDEQGKNTYIPAIVLGVFESLLFMTPFGYWMINGIDNFLNKIFIKTEEVK